MTVNSAPLFDTAALHPNAAKAIDADAKALLGLAQIGTMSHKSTSAFPSRRVPKVTITDEDIVGESLMTRVDMRGRTTERYFIRDGKLVALREQGYEALRKLVEKVLRTRPFNDGLSEEFIEIEIFQWWRAKLRGETQNLLTVHLFERCLNSVKRHKILVPLSNIEIEKAFRLGNVLVTPIGRSIFDESEATNVVRFPDRASEISEGMEELRDQFAHLTAVGVDVVGEPKFAMERAVVVAADLADVLRFMSPATITWDITFACQPLGREHEPAQTTIDMTGDKLGTISTGFINRAPFRWRLSLAELDEHMQYGFRNCAVFFEDRPLSDFQKRVKASISAYSQGIATSDLRHRLMYAMSAAEYLLLRDENEPIQSAVGERMAFMIAKPPNERRAIVARA